MKTLALRIYLAVVAVLLLFALASGWLAQRNLEREVQHFQAQNQLSANRDRSAAWGELIENSLPGAEVAEELQRDALLDWSQRLRLPMALDNPRGLRIATSPLMTERLERWPEMQTRLQRTPLSDGRTLWVLRPGPPSFRGMGPRPPNDIMERLERRENIDHGERGERGEPGEHEHGPRFGIPPREEPLLSPVSNMLPQGWAVGAPALLIMLMLVFAAVAIVAWPVASRLTRRLQALTHGVERFGSGQLGLRVEVEGKDEVAELARSFNEAAQRIEDLVTAHRTLLANASHELRSPLARMKMAVSMLSDMPPERAAQLKQEIHEDIRELDELVEEVLLASRLDAKAGIDLHPVDLLGLMTEEARRTGAEVHAGIEATTLNLQADDRLLRRAVRNLLENARRYGRQGQESAQVDASIVVLPQAIDIVIEDRGPGVPLEQRDRIFEPFYRLPGHAEHAGGVGLGLSLVRQIARKHGGEVRCEAREGGGSRFVISLPRLPS
jgi:signal transduction histidine kinase